MKNIALIAMTAAAAIATPAMAQSTTTVTGTINIEGSVAPKCFVQTGETTGSTFGGIVSLGELAKADGTLEDSSVLEAAFNGANASVINALVICTATQANVTVDADPLVNTASAATGYTNTVNYSADVAFTLATGTTPTTVKNLTTASSATQGTLTAPFKTGGTHNVEVRTSGWTANGVLVAGEYDGKIVVTIEPSVS